MSDLLPPNATQQERALANTVARISAIPVPVRSVWNPDTCSAALLPWLAWAFSVDEWDASWSDAQKRDTIKRAVVVHRYKGTIGAVREVIAALGINCQVQEWFNQIPEGAPYTFRLILDADQDAITQDMLTRLLRMVSSAKNLRSHLDAVVPGVTSENTMSIGGAPGVGSEITVKFGGSNLLLDGTWMLDGTYNLNSLKI